MVPILPLSLVLWTTLLIGTCLGQHYAMDQCPKLPAVQNFAPGKFIGLWHIYEQVKVKAESEMSCKTLTFGEDGTVKLDFTARSKPLSVQGRFLIDASSAGIIKAKFDFSDVLGSDETGSVMWFISDTDYSSYAILMSCTQYSSLTNKQYLYVLSRNVNPNAYSQALMEVGLMNSHFQGDQLLYTEDPTYCGKDNNPFTSQSHGLNGQTQILNEGEVGQLQNGLQNPFDLISGGGTPAIIHINIADSSISLNTDSLSSAAIQSSTVPSSGSAPPPPTVQINTHLGPTTPTTPTGNINPHFGSYPSVSTGMLDPTGLTGGDAFIPAANLYQEIDISDSRFPEVDIVNPRVASFIKRLKSQPNFVEWSQVVDSPRFRHGLDTENDKLLNPKVQMFIKSLLTKPNFLDFAINSDRSLYRNKLRNTNQNRYNYK